MAGEFLATHNSWEPSDLVASLNRRSVRCDAACVDIRSDASRIYARRSRTPFDL